MSPSNLQETPKPWDKSSNTSPDMEIVPMVLDLIEGISSVRIYIPSVRYSSKIDLLTINRILHHKADAKQYTTPSSR